MPTAIEESMRTPKSLNSQYWLFLLSWWGAGTTRQYKKNPSRNAIQTQLATHLNSRADQQSHLSSGPQSDRISLWLKRQEKQASPMIKSIDHQAIKHMLTMPSNNHKLINHTWQAWSTWEAMRISSHSDLAKRFKHNTKATSTPRTAKWIHSVTQYS